VALVELTPGQAFVLGLWGTAQGSQLRAVAEVYGSSDAQPAFVQAFVAAWAKVMDLDRFDIA
jgi:catalase (peroxidase I)